MASPEQSDLSSKLKKIELAMREEAQARYPYEACGVVIKKGRKALFIPCRNVSSDPENFFVLEAEDYANAADKGEIVAIWHSHPNRTAKPSEADLVGIENSGAPWYILAVNKGENGEFIFEGPTITEPSGFEMPYLGRPYVFGVMDCYSLVRDYYKREFGILLGDGPRIEFWWKSGLDLLKKGAEEQQLLVLIDQEPQVGDLFLITMEGTVPNHVAIYIGDDMILHHSRDRLSRRDVYAGYFRKHSTAHLRHISKC